MDEWNAQKMLDLYIHDYLVRKNMHSTADILAREAEIHPKTVVINPPEGFLSEWWSLFWDLYSSRLPNNPQGEQGSSSQAPVNDGSLPQNVHHGSPVSDVSYMLQNICPTTPRTGLPNLLQAANPTSMPRPEMGSFLQSSFPAMMPKMEFNPNRFGQTPIPISDNNMRQDQLMAELVAQRAREQENLRLPPRNFDANPNALNVDQIASMLPVAGSSSRRQKKVNSKRQHPVSNDANYGTGVRRTIPSELTPHAPRLIQDDMGHADAGRSIFEKNPSDGCSFPVLGYAVLGSDQQQIYSVPSEGCQTDIYADLAAQASQQLAMCAPENSTKMVTHTLSDDGSKKKGVQIERNTETGKPLDEDIASFFSSDDASDSMNISFTQSPAQKQEQQQQGRDDCVVTNVDGKKMWGSDSHFREYEVVWLMHGQMLMDNLCRVFYIFIADFPFGPIRSIHPSDNKLSCCDFSSQGKFLAAAGHEKKVFIWNLKQSTRNAIQAHTQIITDIRFKANSFMFATSSFDRIVKIWDATNTKRLLHNLVGHVDQVMSVDFHPKKTNILCSCDSNDEIKLWHVKESSCFRTIKGANRQVRFQSRHGNLLAAATGNVINLIDVETGIIQHRFEGHEEEVRTICWDVCGEYLVSASQDSARIWSIVSGGRCIYELASTARDFASCTFHPAYSQVVAVGAYQSIYIWNPTMGNRTWKFNAHQGIIPAMANAPDTNMIASVSHDQWVKLWK